MAEDKAEKDKLKLRHAIAGAMARCTEAIVMFPLDTVKTRLQFQGANNSKNIKNYKGIADALLKIGKEEGIKGFTRGLGPRLTYIVPAAAVSFLCYEEIVRMVKERKSILALTGADLRYAFLPVLGIIGARAVGSLCRTPFDVVKLRLQVQGSILGKTKYTNSKQAIKEIWKTEGPRGLFSYFHVALLRDMPFSIAYFSSYEAMKEIMRRINKYRGKEKMGIIQNLISGGVAGMVSTSITIPIDVVKTRLQTQALMTQETRYRGAWHALHVIAKTEGIKGLTKGLGARILYLTPASAIMFASYEQYKKLMDVVI